MLIDEVKIKLKAGHGGAGRVSFGSGKKSGPDGGNGGKGGDIYGVVTSDIYALNQFSREKHLEAENGQSGKDSNRAGLNGKDLRIHFPIGTILTDHTGGNIELDSLNDQLLLCKGGLGGKGNAEFKSSRNTTPTFAQSGRSGEEKTFTVVLKLLADYGLVGLPNSGKSSLLNETTQANVKTADYPFTTLEPNLGVLKGKVIADIPGLIEGASENKGLGHKFLKHIEKVGLILHCVAADSKNPQSDYLIIRGELEKFNPELIKTKELILITKSDLISKDIIKKVSTIFKKMKKEVLVVSIYDWDSIEALKNRLILREKKFDL